MIRFSHRLPCTQGSPAEPGSALGYRLVRPGRGEEGVDRVVRNDRPMPSSPASGAPVVAVVRGPALRASPRPSVDSRVDRGAAMTGINSVHSHANARAHSPPASGAPVVAVVRCPALRSKPTAERRFARGSRIGDDRHQSGSFAHRCERPGFARLGRTSRSRGAPPGFAGKPTAMRRSAAGHMRVRADGWTIDDGMNVPPTIREQRRCRWAIVSRPRTAITTPRHDRPFAAESRACTGNATPSRVAIRPCSRSGPLPWACPQSRAAHHGYDWCALAGEDRNHANIVTTHALASWERADGRSAVGLPAKPGGAPRLRLVRPRGRGAESCQHRDDAHAGVVATRGRAFGRGLARKAGRRTTATTGMP